MKNEMKASIKERLQTNQLLNECKAWSGSFISKEKSMKVVKARLDQEHFFVKTKNSFFAHTYREGKLQQPKLYTNYIYTSFVTKVNKFVRLASESRQSSAATIKLWFVARFSTMCKI